MTPRDWTLLVTGSAKGRALQPVHLQKALFLIGALLSDGQRKTKGFYRFEPYDYGPFCREVYTDAEALSSEGLVEIERRSNSSYREYSAAEAGRERAGELKKELSPEVIEYVAKLVEWVASLSFNQLVSWVYKNFPEMKVNSVFQE